MNVSLKQAIEIHARSLKFRFGVRKGKLRALEQARRCAAKGDDDGAKVWMLVKEALRAHPSAESDGAGHTRH